MTDVKQVVVPAAEFAGTTFWRRANATAADQGHDGHPTMLVGETNSTDAYRLRCLLCDTTIIDISVDRSAGG
ncbi:hypothetical protein ACIBCR_15545 [Micromonospora echinospora]|uniref:hypothetical protein n=1 Tax=Micromonospora echinospora TaxID=1877 RepID=UPI0037A3426B